MHTNSIAAWIAGQKEFPRRAKAILTKFLRIVDNPGLSDREVMEALGFTDMNSVRPRITELVKGGWLVEGTSVPDHVTGKLVRTCLPSAKLLRCGMPETTTQTEMELK